MGLHAAPDSPAISGRFKRGFALSAGAVLLLALALRVYRLGAVPLWYDEAMYAWLARGFTPALFSGHDVLVEPLFVVMLSWWVQWGSTEVWLRLPAVLAGLGAVAAAGLLAGGAGGRRAVLPGMVLAALSPLLIHYSRELKMYEWVILWQLLCTAAALHLPFTTRPFLTALVYTASAAAYCNTVFSAPLFFIPLNVGYLVFFFRPWKRLGLWIAAQAVTVLLSVPFILAEQHYFEAMRNRMFHAAPPSLHAVWISVGNFAAGYGGADLLRLALVLLLGGLAVWGILRSHRGMRPGLFLLLTMVLQITLLFLLSEFGKKSLYIDRYVVGVSGLWLALAGAGLGALPPWPRRTTLLAVAMLMLMVLPAVYEGALPKKLERRRGIIDAPDSPAIAQYLRARVGADDRIAHAFWETEPVLRWYTPELNHLLVDQGSRLEFSLDLVSTKGAQAFFGWRPRAVEGLLAASSPIWLVLPEQDEGWESIYAGLFSTLSLHGAYVAGRNFATPNRHRVGVYGFQPRPGHRLPLQRASAKLPLRDPVSGSNEVEVSLRALDMRSWELTVDAPAGAGGIIAFEILNGGVSIPVAAMSPAGDAASPWITERKIAGGAPAFPYVARYNWNSPEAAALTAIIAPPRGRYEVCLEINAPEAGSATVAADFQLRVNEVVLQTGSLEASPGGWGWHSLGQVDADGGDLQLELLAARPDGKVSVQTMASFLSFIPVTGGEPYLPGRILQEQSPEMGSFIFNGYAPFVVVSSGPFSTVLWDYAGIRTMSVP